MTTCLRTTLAFASLAVGLALASPATADVVFQNQSNNGFFTPFNASNASTVKYGDGGWLTGFGSPPVTLASITLGLCVYNGPTAGSTDLVVTLNDGDPSGLAFGSGAELFSTQIRAFELPATDLFGVVYLDLTIPLPSIATLGNFNDVGWSVALANFDYAGSFGFQVSTASGQSSGFYTVNASFFDGASWSLFSFGGDPETGVANYVATIESAPACQGDLNGDGLVDGADLGILLGSWGDLGGPADLNGDGLVDGSDLGLLLGAWGSCSA
jgi:hypothetical protein